MSAPPLTNKEFHPRHPGAGSDYVVEPNAPEETLRYWVVGDAYPRLVLDVPNHQVLVGDGTVPPVSATVGTAAPNDATYVTLAASAGLSAETTLGNVIRRDVVANRGAFGTAGIVFGATDTGIGYRDSGTSWDPYFAVLDGSGKVNTSVLPPISSTLAGLTDVDLTGLTDLDLLQYSAGASKWLRVPASGFGTTYTAGTGLTLAGTQFRITNIGPGATGPLGSATTVPVVTINAQGQTTALTSAAIQIAESAVTNLTTDLAAKFTTSTALGGDLTGTLPNPTLIATGPGATGPLGSATTSAIVTIDAKGRVTALTSAAIAIAESAVTNLVADLAAKFATATALGGDLTGTLPNPTLATFGPGATGPIGSATTVPVVTIDAKGRVSALTSAAIAIAESAVTNLVTDLAGKAAKTAAGGPYGSATSIPGITVNADGSLSFTANAIVLPKFGGLLVIGHSYTQNGGNRSSQGAPGLDVWSNWTHRVAGALQIPVEEVFLWGKSSARAGVATLGDGSTLQGSGVVMRHHVPNHWYTPSLTAHQSSKGWPALIVMEYGYNDVVNGWQGGVARTQAENAFMHGMRSMISRVRARLLYEATNATIAYTGTWSTQTDKNYCTKGTYKKTTTNTDLFTITLPTTLEGDSADAVIVAVCMIGTPNAWTTTTNSATSTSLPVAARDNFPQSGNFDIIVNGATRTVTAGQGTGAGTFTLSSSATWTSGQDVVRASGALVTWSGTSGVTGTTTIGGQGATGVPCHVVKRFTLTRAAAGTTIIGTLSAFATSEEFDLDSWWIEETDPQQVLCVNQPLGALGTTLNLASDAGITTNNTDLATVVAEFSNNVAVVDLVPTFNSLYRAICQAATSTGTNVHIIPDDPTNCVIGVGSILHVDQEEMLVTAITKTSNSDWSLTVTRDYTTAPDGRSTGGNVNHLIAAPIYDMRPWTLDRVHPSDEGHVLIGSLVLAAVAGSTQTAREIANSGGYVQKRQPKLLDGGFLWVQGGTRSTTTNATNPGTLNMLTAGRIYVPEAITLTSLSIQNSGTVYAANAVVRMGVWADGNQQPGALILDAGTVDVHASAAVQTLTCWVPLKPGWYWLGAVIQGAAGTGTITVTTDVRSSQPLANTTNPLSTTFADNNGVRLSGVSAGLPDPFGTPTAWQSGATAATGIICVTAGYTIPIKD